MTQPGSQGYPDWKRVYNLANTLYADEEIFVNNTTITRGPFYVGTQAFLGIYMEVITGGFSFRFNFYDSEAKTTLLSRHEFDLPDFNVTCEQSVPVLGPWVEVEAQTSAVNGDALFRVWASFGQTSISFLSNDNVLMSRVNTAIGAGATVTVNALAVWPGQAFLNFQQVAGTCTLKVQTVDRLATATDIWHRALTAAQPVGELIALTSEMARVTITNTSGAPTNFDLHLVGRQTLLGG